MAADAAGVTEKSFTVGQINQAIGGALQDAFPDPFWVVGELQGYERDASKASQRRWGQVYFELVEKEEGSDAAKASAKALMWGDAMKRVSQRLAAAGADLRLADGLKIRVLCQVDFYWPRASLQLKVLDVDPNFTLGDLEKAKRELLEKLRREGLYDANRGLPMPTAPRGVGLITSEGSAAYHDFMHELGGSGYGFDVRLVDARMQGEETEPSVVNAMRVLEKDPAVEVIALVRGGGSRSDLMWFDREKIAFAVARCSKPVVTGIGHEIDLSVADLVAHASQKTPTACAAFLVERVRAFDAAVAEAGGRLAVEARERLSGAGSALSNAVTHWRHLAGTRLQAAATGLTEAGRALASGARRHLAVRREQLSGAGPRGGRAALMGLASRRDKMDALARELFLKDPRRLLERGYGLVYLDGVLVKKASSLRPGARTVTRFQDGAVESEVTALKKDTP